jgi:hypothetical protein
MKMRGFDKVFEAGFTASGISPKGSFGVNSPEGRIAWTITVIDGQCAIVESIQDAAEPSADYVKRPDMLKKMEKKIGQFAGVVKTRTTYFGSEYSSRTSLTEMYDLGPDGQPQKVDTEGPQVIILYHPDDSALTLPYKQIMWSLGRGYAKFINEVTELAMQEDGTIRFSANGTGLGASRNGRWEITVDPSAAYLVRSAKFFRRPDKPKPMAVITTSGTKWENGRCIPETASWEDNYGPGFTKRSVAYTCETIRAEPDFDLLKMAQEKLYGPYERYTEVIDRRMTPSSIRRYRAKGQDSLTRETEATVSAKTGEDNGEGQQIEMLLDAVRRAQRPVADMSVHLIYRRNANTTRTSKFPSTGDSGYQEDISIVTSGARSRVERQFKHYKEDLQEWRNTVSDLSVYNGQQFRKLRTIFQSGLHPKCQGSQDIKDNNAGVFCRRRDGMPFNLNNQKELSTITFELQASPAPGVHILDAMKENGVRTRFTIDGNRGFNVTRLQAILPDGSIDYETNFKLREYGEIWYPCEYAKIRHGRIRNGRTIPERVEGVTEFKSVEFNIAVDDDMFELEFRPEIRVFDAVRQEYVTGCGPVEPI